MTGATDKKAPSGPVVSVTIAAYNVDSYLRRCLDCVVSQTLEDIEIICVNDGSTDHTLDILTDFALRDHRIRIIDKPVNEGLSVARSDAMALASGKYIGFVDADDLLSADLFRAAYRCAEEHQSDLVLWDYAVFRDEDELERKVRAPSALTHVSAGDKHALLRRPAFAWTKLIRADAVRALGMCFPNGLTYQDIPVHWTLVTQLDAIALLPKRLSYYRQQPSATTHGTSWRRADLFTIMDIVRNYLDEQNLYPIYKNLFLQKRLESMHGIYDLLDSSLKPKAMQLILERLGVDEWQYILDKEPLRWQARDFYMGIHGSTSAKARRLFWLSSRGCARALNPSRHR